MLGVSFKGVGEEVLAIRELVKLEGSFKRFLLLVASRARSGLIKDRLANDEVFK